MTVETRTTRLRKVIDRFCLSDTTNMTAYDLMNGHVFLAPDETGKNSLWQIVCSYYVRDMAFDTILPLDFIALDSDNVRVIGFQGYKLTEEQEKWIAIYNQAQISAQKYHDTHIIYR